MDQWHRGRGTQRRAARGRLWDRGPASRCGGDPRESLPDHYWQAQPDSGEAEYGGGAGNHTLRWDSNNVSATRFTVLATIHGAVLNNNTGLVGAGARCHEPNLGCSDERLCQQDGWGYGGLAAALGGGVIERAGWLAGSGRAVCSGQRLHHQHQRYYSWSPVGLLLVGDDERTHSVLRVGRELRQWQCGRQR